MCNRLSFFAMPWFRIRPYVQVMGFIYSFGTWLLHPELHARANPRKPEHRCRPRIFTFVCAQSGSGKSPWFEQCVLPIFVSTTQQKAFITEWAHLLPQAADAKGVYFSQGTDPDFCCRMSGAQGRLFWTCDEALSALDCDYATGSCKMKDQGRIDLQQLLSCVNGGPYGPRSLKSRGLRLTETHVKKNMALVLHID